MEKRYVKEDEIPEVYTMNVTVDNNTCNKKKCRKISNFCVVCSNNIGEEMVAVEEISAGTRDDDLYLIGEVVTLNGDEKSKIRVRTEPVEELMYDYCEDTRGVWVETPSAYYLLQDPSEDFRQLYQKFSEVSQLWIPFWVLVKEDLWDISEQLTSSWVVEKFGVEFAKKIEEFKEEIHQRVLNEAERDEDYRELSNCLFFQNTKKRIRENEQQEKGSKRRKIVETEEDDESSDGIEDDEEKGEGDEDDLYGLDREVSDEEKLERKKGRRKKKKKKKKKKTDESDIQVVVDDEVKKGESDEGDFYDLDREVSDEAKVRKKKKGKEKRKRESDSDIQVVDDEEDDFGSTKVRKKKKKKKKKEKKKKKKKKRRKEKKKRRRKKSRDGKLRKETRKERRKKKRKRKKRRREKKKAKELKGVLQSSEDENVSTPSGLDSSDDFLRKRREGKSKKKKYRRSKTKREIREEEEDDYRYDPSDSEEVDEENLEELVKEAIEEGLDEESSSDSDDDINRGGFSSSEEEEENKIDYLGFDHNFGFNVSDQYDSPRLNESETPEVEKKKKKTDTKEEGLRKKEMDEEEERIFGGFSVRRQPKEDSISNVPSIIAVPSFPESLNIDISGVFNERTKARRIVPQKKVRRKKKKRKPSNTDHNVPTSLVNRSLQRERKKKKKKKKVIKEVDEVGLVNEKFQQRIPKKSPWMFENLVHIGDIPNCLQSFESSIDEGVPIPDQAGPQSVHCDVCMQFEKFVRFIICSECEEKICNGCFVMRNNPIAFVECCQKDDFKCFCCRMVEERKQDSKQKEREEFWKGNVDYYMQEEFHKGQFVDPSEINFIFRTKSFSNTSGDRRVGEFELLEYKDEEKGEEEKEEEEEDSSDSEKNENTAWT